jgi:hypothetical protein
MPPREPRARRGLSGRGRTFLIVALVALFFLGTSLRGIAGVWTDYLWFDSLGFSSVWRGVLSARVALGVIFTGTFFLLMWLNLVIADRMAPKFRPAGPEEELLERYHALVGRRAGLVRIAVAGLFAFIAGAGVSAKWQDWVLFTNRVDFGIKDPQFGTDIGFYVFQLPFLSFVVSWLFAAFVIIFIVVVVAHYLNGGIRVQSPGQRVTPQVKAHLSVLLGVMALIKAADYWLQRYELTLSSRGAVDGATYTDVNAQLPAIYLLLLISLLSAVLFLVNIRRRGWVLPVLAVGLWAFVAIVAGGIYPAFVQRFQVEPAESTKEEPYIQRNIDATRAAFGLDAVDTEAFAYDEDLDAAALSDNAGTVRNIRLLDPAVVNTAYQQLQAERGFYTFPGDLDVDRYTIDGETTQVVLGARQLDPGDIPQQSWEGQRLAFTHGFGLALSPANAVTEEGRPDFIVRNVPVVSDVPSIDVSQPQLYFGENLGGYSIVDTTRDEVDYLNEAGETITYRFEGDGGVGIGSFMRQAAFALRFGDIDPVVSNFLTPESRIMYVRDVRERVETVAPFLEFDADPYPVVADDGRIVYVIDGYTTSNHYPYSQQAENNDLPDTSGLNGSFNYVRNSIKAVVDGYNGDVTLYVLPDDMLPSGGDPIAEAYRQAFPDLFEDFEDMPEDLQQHIRYPDDVFRVQTNMWGRYHIGDATDFYEQTGGWAVAQDPGNQVAAAQTTSATNEQGQVVSTSERRIDPYYQLMRLPDEDQEAFLSLRPFVPASENDDRRQLTSFMTAKSDPDEYGRLQVFEMPGTQVDGPTIVSAAINSDPAVSREITLLDQQGSQVKLGNLLIIPIDQSLLYIRPLYTEASTGTQVPSLERVIVVYGDRVVINDTLQESLEELFGEAPDTQEQAPDGEPSDEPTDEPAEPPAEDPDAEVADLLAQADQLFQEADAALADGDLGTYDDKVEEARDLLGQALELTGGIAPTTSTTAAEPDSA